MRIARTVIIAGAATLALAGAAFAARDGGKLMLVALPDGSVQHIQYQGDAEPRILFVRAPDPAGMIAEMERISAAMDARAAAMMRQAVALRPQAEAPAPAGAGIVLTNDSGQPVGVMQYSYISSTTGPDGCTHTVSYSSDAASAQQPKVVQTSSGSCGTAASHPAITPTAASPSPTSATQSAPHLTSRLPPSRT